MNNDGNNEMPFEWVTLTEAAKWLRVSEVTVRRMLKAGRLAGAVRVDSLGKNRGQWRFHLPTLRQHLLREINAGGGQR